MSTFKVDTEDNNIIVKGAIHPYNPAKTPRRKIYTDEVKEYLKGESVEFGKCIEETFLDNTLSHRLEGIWIFERFEKKTIKPLDKSSEYVILSKEKKTEPKKKSKAKKNDK